MRSARPMRDPCRDYSSEANDDHVERYKEPEPTRDELREAAKDEAEDAEMRRDKEDRP